MFSVNVDKLIRMTPEETKSYAVTAEAVLRKIEGQCRSVAIVGGNISSFKLASAFMEKGHSVLFVDADTSEEVFLSKYRLGKNLKGFTDYLLRDVPAESLICVTNRERLDVIFTGDIQNMTPDKITADKIQQMFEECLDTYDLIIVQSDGEGRIAVCCDSTVVIMESSEYSEMACEVKVDELNEKGCLVLGVIIDE